MCLPKNGIIRQLSLLKSTRTKCLVLLGTISKLRGTGTQKQVFNYITSTVITQVVLRDKCSLSMSGFNDTQHPGDE